MKFLVSLIGFGVAVALSVATLINGYGLTVHSWGWVIWGSIGSAMLGAIFQVMKDH